MSNSFADYKIGDRVVILRIPMNLEDKDFRKLVGRFGTIRRAFPKYETFKIEFPFSGVFIVHYYRIQKIGDYLKFEWEL